MSDTATLTGHWSDCAVHNEPAFPNGPCNCGFTNPDTRQADAERAFLSRILGITNKIVLGENFAVTVDRDDEGRVSVQVSCYRRDVITGEMGWGQGGKSYPSPERSDGDIVKMIFGLYLAYVEHEARETFQYLGARVFGPHTHIDALVEAAKHVDIPSAHHEGAK